MPRLGTLAQALHAACEQCATVAGAVFPARVADWFVASIEHGLSPQDAQRAAPRPLHEVAPGGWPATEGTRSALLAIDELVLACLGAMLDAQALDRRALAVVLRTASQLRGLVVRQRPGVPQSVQQALAARDRQLSIATHELRTPISTILLNLQMLQRAAQASATLEGASVARMLTVPSRQLRRLIRMVDLLLDTAQVESDRLVLNPQPLDLCELAHDVAVRLQAMADSADCRLAVDACEPVVGQWDRLRLEQVVHNLLTNAIKYGGGRVVLAVHAARGDPPAAVLEVRDRGGGIDPEDQERIFEPFKRLPSAASEDGAGLGLYIVREIVAAHGGRIEVDSRPGHGATFRVHLPRSGEDTHGKHAATR